MKTKSPGRTDKPYPKLTCVACGETKSALRFYKRSGPTYEDVPALDPRRYHRQCKKCMKPAKVGQAREEIAEPRTMSRVISAKAKARKYKKKKPSKMGGLTPAQYKKKVRSETRVRSMIYLAEKGCQKCGERDPRKLEYDHKDPADKKRVIARLISNGYSWSSPILRSEIRKCRILCANCHREHTVKQQGYYACKDVQQTLRDLAGRFGFKLR